jgi:hypothetical protein
MPNRILRLMTIVATGLLLSAPALVRGQATPPSAPTIAADRRRSEGRRIPRRDRRRALRRDFRSRRAEAKLGPIPFAVRSGRATDSDWCRTRRQSAHPHHDSR